MNECTCSNGNGTTGSNCLTDGVAKCGSCDSGYNINGTVCEMNECFCANGNGTTGLNCLTDGATKCGSCDSGYNLNSNFFGIVCASATPV